ncbi:MAG: allophanate hydrolase [Chloroflexi bacterium]|nr:allophanate hydrolase [Chloroflexota bacterium]|tara:strand:+ start:55560 stop:56228 length:669 start_codon:yes stop_codon:yes gene_type:complete
MKNFFVINFHGDSTLVIKLGEEIDIKTNQMLHEIVHLLEIDLKFNDYIEDIYPTFNSIIIDYDNLLIDFENLKSLINKKLLSFIKKYKTDSDEKKIIEVPVKYGSENGPDLSMMSDKLKISEEKIIEIHTSSLYRIFMIGFMPGFPYLGGLSKKISFPRLSTPRISVPAGSVGIAGIQTGIYPFASPGGWNIIGKTEKKLFDINLNPPALLEAGTNLRFVKI